MRNTKHLFRQLHTPPPHYHHSFSLVEGLKVKAIRTIRYVASLVWSMILLQHCHPAHKLNIDPLEVSSTTATPRVAGQAAGHVVPLSSHAAVVPTSLPKSASSLISNQSSQQELVRAAYATALGPSLTNAQSFFGTFSASTGERVTFKQGGNRWYAETSLGVLPVQSQATVDRYLRWLCSQDRYVSRSRVHIMQNPNDQGRCVYLGKAGLLGGSPTTQDEERRPGSPMLPAMAFGAREWEEYMDASVDEEPPLPPDIDTILNADCPFLLDGENTPQKVKDNHVLVLIPAHVNGEPFTLNKLGALIKAKVFPYNEHGYGNYSGTVRKELGSKPLPQAPYWILLTRRVIEGSLRKPLSTYEAMVNNHGDYSVPHALEAATAMLAHYLRSGQRLYGTDPQSMYTRCRETVDSDNSVFVGAIHSLGIDIGVCSSADFGTHIGVLACQKLEERLLKVGKRKRSVRETYKSLPKPQQEARSPIELRFRTKLKVKELEQAQAAANREQEDRTMLPAIAFGAREWEQYMGVAVGEEPPLPRDIDKVLNADCPFLLERERKPQKVRDNHVLVLIPARVNGESFTLDKLGALVKAKVFPQNEYGYGNYSDTVRKEMGSKPLAQTSYWILLTKRVIKGSLNQHISAHKTMIEKHDGYSMPHALEAATAMLAHYVRSGQRLYGDEPWRYTRCWETMMGSDTYSVFVGAFDSLGLEVDDCYFGISESGGVSGCRKL